MPTLVKHQDRVILLLDLDSFYAQCECVRLGLDSTTTALALLQWNSSLAVTYPARSLGIKRGSGWDEVLGKKCLGVHVPVLTRGESDADESAVPMDSTLSLEEEYNKIFRQSPSQQEEARRTELGVRRFSHEGKACIERYRIASARIFRTVLDWIEQTGLNIVLERASIDEFFLDVTSACSEALPDEGSLNLLEETKVIGENAAPFQASDAEGDSEYLKTIYRGCRIAHNIRKAIGEQLGFTLSAGISCNKTLAKLSAAYGKPNHQAVTFPDRVDFLLNETEIGKCRNLGGKLGARVQALLRPGVPKTVGSIARHLSLPELERGIGDSDTARWVYQVAQGVDTEAVVPKNDCAMTKSITAFKTLQKGHTMGECDTWIRLLAKEIVTRVERDAARNRRYPKTCVIQYNNVNAGGKAERRRTGRNPSSRSVRTNFPPERLSTEDKIRELVDCVPSMIISKEGKTVLLDMVGLCAVDLVTHDNSRNAIHNYFSASTQVATDACRSFKSEPNNVIHEQDTCDQQHDADLYLARKLQTTYESEARILQAIDESKTRDNAKRKSPVVIDEDLLLAKRLQAEYDRELRVLQAFDRRDAEASKLLTGPKKKPTIESFFQKR